MRFRKPIEEIYEYVDNFTEEFLETVREYVPDFKQTITLNCTENILCIREILKGLYHEFEDKVFNVKGKETVNDVDLLRVCYDDTTGLPEIDWTNWQAKERSVKQRKDWKNARPFGHTQWKTLVRAGLFKNNMHLMNNDTEIYMEYHEQHSNMYVSAKISLVNGKLGAKVYQSLVPDTECPSNYVFKDECVVWEIQPVKLTKFLKKIECGDKFITKVADKVSNKPVSFTMKFTDCYFAEMYIHMKETGKGLSSCMAHRSGDYYLNDDEHPMLTYDHSPNAVLALIYNNDTGKYVARAILKTDVAGFKYNSVYGTTLLKRLNLFGLTNQGSMNGLELQCIETCSGGILAPYVDGSDNLFTVDGNTLLVNEYGDLQSDHETGCLEGEYYCNCCDRRVDEVIWVQASQVDVCNNCLDEYYVECEDGEWRHQEEVVCALVENGYDGYVPDDVVVFSEYHGQYVLDDCAVYVDALEDYLHVNDDEESICEEVLGEDWKEVKEDAC